MRSAQDDLLKWGAVVALGRRDAEDDVPYRFARFSEFNFRR